MVNVNTCFLDMDGVIADFVGGACLAHGIENPYKDPASAGIFETEKLLGMTEAEFWRPLGSLRFWAELNKTAEADAIVSLVTTMFSLDNVVVLTSPSQSPDCMAGKKIWLTMHYPKLKNVIFAPAHTKRLLAGPDRVLIDDRDENIETFVAAGGRGLLIPRPWNRYHHVGNPLAYIERMGRIINAYAAASVGKF
jgi:5'(3')-deoxyribonucleotidase